MREMGFFSRCVAVLLVLIHGSMGAQAVEWNAAFQAINASDIENHVAVLADDAMEGREKGTRGGRAAGTYLLTQFERLGLQPAGERGTFFQEFQGGARNILAILEGADPELKQEIVLVGAHYDHVGYGNRKNSFGPFGYVHNGADDNASGVAGVLEVIEGFLACGERPKRSILFAFWDGEEAGLLGSKTWMERPTVPRDRVVVALNADMIGRLRNRQVMIYGSRSATGLRRLVSQANRWTDLQLDFTWDLQANSDHFNFYAGGIPVLMVHTGLHDHYHRPSDDAHLINCEGGQDVGRLLFCIASELADRTERTAFRAASRSEKQADLKLLETPAPTRPPRLGVTFRRDEKPEPGMYVTHVVANTGAAEAGIRIGDCILQFAGHAVQDEHDLRMRILAARSPATLSLRRPSGETHQIEVALSGAPLRLGLSWREDSGEPGTLVLTEVVPGSAAERAGLQVADRIYRAAGRDFANSDEFQQIVGAASEHLEVEFERKGCICPVMIELPEST